MLSFQKDTVEKQTLSTHREGGGGVNPSSLSLPGPHLTQKWSPSGLAFKSGGDPVYCTLIINTMQFMILGSSPPLTARPPFRDYDHILCPSHSQYIWWLCWWCWSQKWQWWQWWEWWTMHSNNGFLAFRGHCESNACHCEEIHSNHHWTGSCYH